VRCPANHSPEFQQDSALPIESTILVAFGLVLGGFVKGAIGLGLPLVTIPILAAFLGVPHAIAIMMVPLVMTNVWQIWQFRAHGNGSGFLKGMLPAGIVGVGFGTWALTFLPATTLSLLLAVMVAIYIGLSLARPDMRISPEAGRRWSPLVGLAGGALQGATGIAAPITVTFIHAMRLARESFVFALSTMFFTFTLAQSAALTVAGILTPERFLQGWIALIPIALGMPLGDWAARRFSRRTFERAILVILAIMAARLFQTGLGLGF